MFFWGDFIYSNESMVYIKSNSVLSLKYYDDCGVISGGLRIMKGGGNGHSKLRLVVKINS